MRTQVRVVTEADVVDGSANVRRGPRNVTVRAPTVKVASSPRASETTTRAGFSSRV